MKAKCCQHARTYGNGLQILPCRDGVSFGTRSTLLWYNGLVCFTAFIVTSFATFILVVEGSFVHGSSIEYITLALSISIILTGVTTLLCCSLVFIASNRRGLLHLYNALITAFTIAIVVEMTTIIIGLGFVQHIEELTNSMVDWSLFIKYYQEEHIHNDLDIIQRELQCCGFKSYEDWDLNPYYSCKSTGHSRCSVPLSCGKLKTAGPNSVLGIRNPKINEVKLKESIYLDGCLKTSKIWYEITTMLLSCSAVLMVVMQCLFLVLLNLVAGHAKNTNNKSSQNSSQITECSSVSKQDTIVKHRPHKSTAMNYVYLECEGVPLDEDLTSRDKFNNNLKILI